MNKDFIERFNLEPHPEGGYYRNTFNSDHRIKTEGTEKSIASACYFYLDSDDFSAWHRLKSDEMLHFYSGGSLTIHMIEPDGKLVHRVLGDPRIHEELEPQVLVKAGHWFAAEVDCENTYAFIGATVFPAFSFDEFELADIALIERFPQHKDIIERLIRE